MEDNFDDMFENDEEKKDFENHYSRYQMQKFEDINFMLEYKSWILDTFSMHKSAMLPKKFSHKNTPTFLAVLDHIVHSFILN